MTNVIASAPPVDQSRPSERSWLPLVSVALALGALWLICFRHLSAEWSYNEQYSYGWFVPFFALYLFWLRWEDAPALQPPEIRNQEPEVSGQRSEAAAVDLNRHHSTLIATFAIAALFLLLPIRLIEIANPDWRPISWIHTLAAVSLTLFVIWRAGGKPWLRHFAFPVVFVLVSVPWISAIEIPIVQGLMPTLASIATEALSLFGIPAEVQGNLVRINGVIVGVNEACSGVRSLQTSLMIGLLFGELKRLGLVKRIALVIGAIAIAFVANCARAFFLVWIAATRGLTEVEKWHDVAGYTIVGLVFFGCLGITALLARGEVAVIDPNRHLKKISDEPGSGNPPAEVRNPNFNFLNSKFYFVALVWLLLVEFGVEWWYRAHETNLPRTVQWSVQWPKAAPDFRDLPIDERTRAILHFDKGRGATWRKPDDESSDVGSAAVAQPISLLFFFRWEPGHNSALLANAHRPDVCLPATGWRQTEDLGVRQYRVAQNLTVPFRHFVFMRDSVGRHQYAHAFYCVWEDRVRPGDETNPNSGMAGDPSAWTRNERMEAVLQGRRHLGQQVLEYLLLEPREIGVAQAEQNFAQQIPQLIVPEAAPARR